MIALGIALAALFVSAAFVACVVLVLRALLTIHRRDEHVRELRSADALALRFEGYEVEQKRVAAELTRLASVTEGIKADGMFGGGRARR